MTDSSYSAFSATTICLPGRTFFRTIVVRVAAKNTSTSNLSTGLRPKPKCASSGDDRPYQKIVASCSSLERFFVDAFLESHALESHAVLVG
jgi:hypothetical protein